MKKFLAILLACVMTLALAVPAMADTAKITVTNPANCQLTLSEGGGECIEYTATGLGVGYTVVAASEDTAVVTIRTVQNSCCIIDAGSAGTTSVRIYVCDENGEEVTNSGSVVLVTVTDTPPATDTTVNSITATVTAELGQKVYDTVPTFNSDPEDGVEYLGSSTYWYRVPAGVDYDKCERELIETVGQDAVFENGYTYFKVMTFGAKTGYELVEDETMLYLNSSETFYLAESVYAVNGVVEFTFDGTQPSTNDTTTATATTTTTTTAAVKTGDSSNAMFYVIALIALVAGAGVTLFATKKSR